MDFFDNLAQDIASGEFYGSSTSIYAGKIDRKKIQGHTKRALISKLEDMTYIIRNKKIREQPRVRFIDDEDVSARS